MQIPYRLERTLRSSVSPGVLLALVASTFIFSATPFLIGMVVERYQVGLTSASLMGVTQLGGFALTSWAAGRFLRPTRLVFVATVTLIMATNAISILLPTYPLLLLLRLGSGMALGVMSWFAWSQVFGDPRGTSDVAVIGPLAGIAASPLIASVGEDFGLAGVFALLTVAAFIPLLAYQGTSAEHRVLPPFERSRAIPVARLLLGALALFTFGGSAVFQFVVVIGLDLDLSQSTIALILAGNAVAGIPATRWTRARGTPGLWIALIGIFSLLVGSVSVVPVFAAAIIGWGFAYWMGVPGVFDLLAARSAHPADRAGDAQSLMAVGRVIGPFAGGWTFEHFGSAALGMLGGVSMLMAGAVVLAVRVFGKSPAGHDDPESTVT